MPLLVPYEPHKGMEGDTESPIKFTPFPPGEDHATQPDGSGTPGNPADQTSGKTKDESCFGS